METFQVSLEDTIDADTLHAQAIKLYRDGSLNESIPLFEQARAAYLAQGEAAKAASVANDLGVVYYLAGRRDEARRILEDARAVFERMGEVAGQARALGNIAQVLNRAGDQAGAEEHYQHAAELFHHIGERALEYDTYRALSQMQLRRGRWLEALAAYDRALAAKGGAGALRAFLQIPLRLLGMR